MATEELGRISHTFVNGSLPQNAQSSDTHSAPSVVLLCGLCDEGLDRVSSEPSSSAVLDDRTGDDDDITFAQGKITARSEIAEAMDEPLFRNRPRVPAFDRRKPHKGQGG
jgi:hypothetical protein